MWTFQINYAIGQKLRDKIATQITVQQRETPSNRNRRILNVTHRRFVACTLVRSFM